MPRLTFDTETSGFPRPDLAADHPDQAHLVQLAARLRADDGALLGEVNVLIEPNGWTIPESATEVHGITTDFAMRNGVILANALSVFIDMAAIADTLVAHNLAFDRRVIDGALREANCSPLPWETRTLRCTMLAATPIVRVRKTRMRHPADWKWPKLEECVRYFFNEEIDGAHDAMVDVRACERTYDELVKQGAFK